MVTLAPSKPVIHTRRLSTITMVAILLAFPVPWAPATFFTALVPNPKLVKPAINPVVEFNRLFIPIPVGPSNTAMIFERTTAIKILNTCTPPKREVALKICLYEEFPSVKGKVQKG
jgi:hypothetical protein